MEIEFDNKIHKIQFPNHPLFIHLGKNSRTKLMLTVSRTTHRDKIIVLKIFFITGNAHFSLNI